jgi:hypothetical protein
MLRLVLLQLIQRTDRIILPAQKINEIPMAAVFGQFVNAVQRGLHQAKFALRASNAISPVHALYFEFAHREFSLKPFGVSVQMDNKSGIRSTQPLTRPPKLVRSFVSQNNVSNFQRHERAWMLLTGLLIRHKYEYAA